LVTERLPEMVWETATNDCMRIRLVTNCILATSVLRKKSSKEAMEVQFMWRL
jgi:hypothetical protein